MAYFQNGVSILGEFFFRKGCQFGVLGGTYPPKKYSIAPPPGSFNQTIPQLSKSPLPVEVVGKLVPSPLYLVVTSIQLNNALQRGDDRRRPLLFVDPYRRRKGKI